MQQIILSRFQMMGFLPLVLSWYNKVMKNLITQNPDILGGKPIISGTRISVETILELISSGMDKEAIIKEYPFLTKKQIQASVNFAAKLVGREESYIFDKAQTVTHEISRRH